MHDIMPCFNPKENDISLFLVLFERQGKTMNIPVENQVAQLIALLPPDIVELIAREPEEDAKKYEYVRAFLLQRFKLSAEKFRQLINKHQKASECELGHIKTKAAVVTNDPGRYVLGNKTAQLLKDKSFLNLEKINAIMTRSQTKRSSEEDRNKEAEMGQTEEMTHFEIVEEILPQDDEEYKKIKKLIKVNSMDFIESQHQSRDLAPLLSEEKK
ncbi:hypothetical protein AVEN_201490-1 [Araneus ventricosus]|uniref:Uncharacterized protein n=1 Tax=Araneus ventricosus TaxID=182803 RepID=A0A4Y2X1C6_ARAVE|nr:hypothetical protein AVEN_260712-1 [Araneus ventricosus]GBO43356.1 hypothetical protein AVEN_201490-1 [Araneus ventricosus]